MLRTSQKMLPVHVKSNANAQNIHLCPQTKSRSLGPLLPATAVTPLLPLPDHLRHALHSLLPLLETALERTLPELTLDLLADTSALDSQAVVDMLLLLDLGVLRRVRHQRQHVVGDGQFEELCLSAQGVVWGVPVAGTGVLEGQEGVAVARVCWGV